jgi:hypothetical protein
MAAKTAYESSARLTARLENREKASHEGAHHHDGRNVGYWYALDPGLTPEQMLEALERAHDMLYSPPGGHPDDDS